MRIMLISGSPRPAARSKALTQYMATILQDLNVEVDHFHIGDTPLPMYDDRDNAYGPEVADLQERASQADGFFIVTPEYHGGPTGSLKNLLDHLDSSHFQGKPVALGVTAGGVKGGGAALVAMRNIVRAVLGWVMPEQVTVSKEDFDEKLTVTNTVLANRLAAMGKNLALYGAAFAEVRRQQAAGQ